MEFDQINLGQRTVNNHDRLAKLNQRAFQRREAFEPRDHSQRHQFNNYLLHLHPSEEQSTSSSKNGKKPLSEYYLRNGL